MKVVSLSLTVLSAMTGFIAAYLWLRASRVDYRPFDEHGYQFPDQDLQVWLGAVRRTVGASGDLNKQAAIWTSISVALSGLSSIVGAFSN